MVNTVIFFHETPISLRFFRGDRRIPSWHAIYCERALFQAHRLIGAVFFVDEKITIPSRFWEMSYRFILPTVLSFFFYSSSYGDPTQKKKNIRFWREKGQKTVFRRASAVWLWGEIWTDRTWKTQLDSGELDLHPGPLLFPKNIFLRKLWPSKVSACTRTAGTHAHRHHRIRLLYGNDVTMRLVVRLRLWVWGRLLGKIFRCCRIRKCVVSG